MTYILATTVTLFTNVSPHFRPPVGVRPICQDAKRIKNKAIRRQIKVVQHYRKLLLLKILFTNSLML